MNTALPEEFQKLKNNIIEKYEQKHVKEINPTIQVPEEFKDTVESIISKVKVKDQKSSRSLVLIKNKYYEKIVDQYK